MNKVVLIGRGLQEALLRDSGAPSRRRDEQGGAMSKAAR